MCTVTFLPLKNNDFILVSSRDVPFSREESLEPKKYSEEGVDLFYPKDGKAGGTWIGTSSKKRLICLLNGGFKNHQQEQSYLKSRGIIVKDLLKVDDISEACKEIDLNGVEPFTMVIIEWDFNLFLFEFVWDGVSKHLRIMPQEAHIWSSSTLYTEEMKKMRENWFSDWKNKKIIVKESIIEFHHQGGIGEPNVDVLMKREQVGTVSITSVSKEKNEINMSYERIDHEK